MSTEMKVSETNGEVSASIEETNRVRAQLGLAPLVEGTAPSKESEARERGAELAEAEAKEEAEEMARKRCETLRRDREPGQKNSDLVRSEGEDRRGSLLGPDASAPSVSRRPQERLALAASQARQQPLPEGREHHFFLSPSRVRK